MKCYNHSSENSIATCKHCNKGLCVKCSSRFNIIICESCLLKYNKSVANEMYTGLAITTSILFGVMFFKGINSFSLGLLLAFTYWGWKFLSSHAPSLTMGTGNVWFFYFMIKFFIAYFIGLFVGPYQIFKMLKEIGIIKKTQGKIENNEI